MNPQRDLPGRPGEQVAGRAAELVPVLLKRSGNPGESTPERVYTLVLVFATFTLLPAWIFVVMWQEPSGPALVLAGLPAWLLVRWLFFWMRGSETGSFVLDDSGVVHVVSGRRSVRRLQRLYEVGTADWMRHSVAIGLALGVLGPIALGVLTVALDAPEIAAVFLTAVGFACLDMARFAATVLALPKLRGQRRLDGNVILPALALYARHHGWEAAVAGVPLDRLAATLAEHPADLDTAMRYSKSAAALAKLGQAGGAAGGAATLL